MIPLATFESFDPRAVSCRMSFGGYKFSAIGGESRQEAIAVCLQTKIVWIDTLNATGKPFVVR
jgi:hypothetical protein